MDPSWVILTICESWEIGPNEAPPATITAHTPDRWKEDIQMKPTVKFQGQPSSKAPGSSRRSGGNGHRESQEVFHFSGHFPFISGHPIAPFPPFLDPLNSFPWSLFADSSPFESYKENKIGQRLDRVFRPPQRLLDQGNGTDEFLVSWDFHLYVVCKFWTSFG